MMGIDLTGDKYYDTWISLVREALSCLDLEKYYWHHLPNSGGYYEQDEFFIIIWNYVRYEYISAKNDNTFMGSLRTKYGKGKS